MTKRLPANHFSLSMSLPPQLPDPGLLVGWSQERHHRRTPMGFAFGNPRMSPKEGYVDPILFPGEGHLITIAPTGAGKGVGCIIPSLLRYEGSVIVIDPKGENAAVTQRRRAQLGQPVHVLDPMDVVSGSTARLNPMDLLDPTSDSFVDDVAMLAEILTARMAEYETRNAYWVGRAREMLIGLIAHVAVDEPAGKRNLARVRELAADMAAAPAEFAKRLKGSDHSMARHVSASLRLVAPETLGGILSFVQEAIDFLRGPRVSAAVSNSTIDLASITAGAPQSIYVVIPPHMLEAQSSLLRLWIGVLLAAVMRRKRRPEKSTLFILDEAAQLGPLPQLRQAITLLRGYGLQTWSFWQDVSQLKYLYPADWATMVNNCRVVQMFGAVNLAAARTMSELVGGFSGENLLDLEEHEMLLQIAGDQPVIARRPNYLNDPAFAELFDPNPMFESGDGPDILDPPPPPPPVSKDSLARPPSPAADAAGTIGCGKGCERYEP